VQVPSGTLRGVPFPDLFLSRPGVAFPDQLVDNAGVIGRVRRNFRGSPADWAVVESSIEKLFALCNSKERYLEDDLNARVAEYAARAARAALTENGSSFSDVDLLIHGGIPRQYFEPATAMEIATRLGITPGHALDVTAACVGHIEALHTAVAQMAIHPEYRAALITTAELTYDYVDYDIQEPHDLKNKAAGLTLGNAAAAFLLRRRPWPQGGIRLLGVEAYSAPAHWELCTAPVGGKFDSSSVELMRLGALVAPVIKRNLEKLGMVAEDIDHFVFHQPSEPMVRKILDEVGASQEKGVYTHHLFGNTASASLGVTYDHLLKTKPVREGQKIVLGSAAAGFTAAMATGVWTRG
jgi:3-oxoacyl-[acyl-carrier-protein] synthase III